MNRFRKWTIYVQWGSEDLKFKQSKSKLFDGRISNGPALTMALVPAIQNPDISVQISNFFDTMYSHLSGFQMVGLPNCRSHPKSGPFLTQPFFNLSKSRFQIPAVSPKGPVVFPQKNAHTIYLKYNDFSFKALLKRHLWLKKTLTFELKLKKLKP